MATATQTALIDALLIRMHTRAKASTERLEGVDIPVVRNPEDGATLPKLAITVDAFRDELAEMLETAGAEEAAAHMATLRDLAEKIQEIEELEMKLEEAGGGSESQAARIRVLEKARVDLLEILEKAVKVVKNSGGR